MSKTPAKTPKDLPEKAEALPDALEIEAEVESVIGDLIPKGARSQVVSRMAMMVSEKFSGPIAHPRHLQAYEDICPGAADRIIRMAEDRSAHLIQMDRTAIEAEKADQARGMFLGAGLFAFLIASALTTAILKLPVAIPGLFLGTAAIGGISLFIKGRNGN